MIGLELENVTKRYGDVVAVRGANVRAERGEFLALLGPSGCGKSSTMRMIAGLEEVSEGRIHFGDRVVNDLPPRQRNVALAFESYALYSPLTVRENLAFPLESRGMEKAAIAERIAEIAERLQLTDLLDRRPAALSGGQSQRVSLARALVREPEVLLLDEPLSHLDQRLRTVLRARIRHIHDTIGTTTTIYVTHDQEEAVALADRIIVMNDAVIQQIGDVDTLWNRPVNLFVAGFLGDPAMNIMEAEISGGSLQLKGDIALPLPARFRPTEAALLCGIRPEALKIAADGAIPGRILVNEFQGDRCILTVESPLGSLKVVTDEDVPDPAGTELRLAAGLDDLHLFDRHTGEALDRVD